MNKQENIYYLLKFTSFNLNTIYNIMNRQIYFQDPVNFNDPLDIEYPLINMNKILNTNNNDNKDGITCFSTINRINKIIYNENEETNEEKGIKKINEINELLNRLLWSHYADMHKGVCLVYKKNNCENENFQSGLIKYVNNLAYNKDILKDIYFYKHKHWEYENEYRFVFKNKKNILVDEKVLGLELDAIVLGLRAYKYNEEKNKQNENSLIELIKKISSSEETIIDSTENNNLGINAQLKKNIPLFYINTDQNDISNKNTHFDLLKLNIENVYPIE